MGAVCWLMFQDRHITPRRAIQSVGSYLCHGGRGMWNSMLICEGVVNVPEDDRQHRRIDSAVCHAQDISVCVFILRYQSFDKWNEAFLDLDQVFPAGHLALWFIVEVPILLDFAMQIPAFGVGCPFIDANAPFAQRFRHFDWSMQLFCHDLRGLLGTQHRAGVDDLERNPRQCLCQRPRLCDSLFGQRMFDAAVGEFPQQVGDTFAVTNEVEFYRFSYFFLPSSVRLTNSAVAGSRIALPIASP